MYLVSFNWRTQGLDVRKVTFKGIVVHHKIKIQSFTFSHVISNPYVIFGTQNEIFSRMSKLLFLIVVVPFHFH